MASCSTCGTTILFGGQKLQDLRFCGAKCAAEGQYLLVARQIPADVVEQFAGQLHAGLCPKCKGPGPVDVHKAYSVWSALYLTSWKTQQYVCCKSCGSKEQWKALGLSMLVGWWGFPWGFLVTPLQVARNIGAMRKAETHGSPSDDLRRVARLGLARQVASAPKVA